MKVTVNGKEQQFDVSPVVSDEAAISCANTLALHAFELGTTNAVWEVEMTIKIGSLTREPDVWEVSARLKRPDPWDRLKLEVYRALGIDRLAAWLARWLGGQTS